MPKILLHISLFLFCIKIYSEDRPFVLVIDPGHGGKDPGALASSKKYKHEKHLALDIALKFGDYVKKNIPGVKVIYTREDDTFISLIDRSDIANKNKADLFVSIHCNSSRKSVTYGTETYVMGVHKNEENLEVAKKENSVIRLEEDYSKKYQNFNPESPASIISMTLLQSSFLNNSILFSSELQKEFEKYGRKNNGVKQAGFYVISFNSMPSVLVEVGYISNSSEEKFLNSSQGRDKIVSSLCDAFKKYKNHFDLNRNREETIINDVKKENNDIRYKVQLFATSKKVTSKNKVFQNFKNIEVYKENGLYKYITGNEKSVENAYKIKKTAISKGYSKAFVIIFENGKKMDTSEASSFLKNSIRN